VLGRAYNNPLDFEEQASLPFVGGIRQHGYQCGQIWGASLAAGARVYQQKGAGVDSEMRSVKISSSLVEVFREGNGEVNCHEITTLNKDSTGFDMAKYFLLKGGSIGCFRMASHYAPLAYDAIEENLKEADSNASDQPFSCTALLAKKAGANEKHQTMAAGLAGGIGLCGEACGALGTAVWIKAMQAKQQNPEIDLWGDKDFSQDFETLVEVFLEASDYEFECANIVGRKFKDVEDHGDHLKQGGCSRIIDALADNLS